MPNLSIESGLAAHFKQAQGPSLQGVSWLVRIDHGGHTHHARVKALLAPDATKATRQDQAYQAQTTMEYLNDQMAQGWNPADEREHIIHISNPLGQQPKPWWRFW